MIKYNVIIVGAGPAGSFLAYKLRNQGISVLNLEKETFPRYKICAGGLSKKTYDMLLSENINVESIIEKKVKKELFVRNEKYTFRESEEDLIYMIYRSEFDNFLRDQDQSRRNSYRNYLPSGRTEKNKSKNWRAICRYKLQKNSINSFCRVCVATKTIQSPCKGRRIS